ncbi:DUF3784 domain-containing protein [Zeaxanthinibacter enoshimensis]|uniref:Uncharacterized protein DUF3784 n=1 Tax=Zeaxanthinibacter enoshimensis TaxID=392009 RepID=A0A4R6TQS4_9FLAO|nr:DUF3784 domain-containing protein [Zeaxanthinibacter enoshimensis]TDQ32209.1 uncharacterized protein DUF3784 [Zeaxanthinibacter enoshimensis]
MIAVAIIFVIAGGLIKFGKMYFLIAGYNTLPKEEKAKYNAAGLATVMCYGLLGMAVIIVLGYLAARWLDHPGIENYALFGALVVGLPYILINANSGKYRKDKR